MEDLEQLSIVKYIERPTIAERRELFDQTGVKEMVSAHRQDHVRGVERRGASRGVSAGV